MPTIKSDKFTVKSYKLWTSQGSDMVRRTIELVSGDIGHGIYFKVILVSLPKNVYGPEVGQMDNYQATNFNPVSIAAWIDPLVFDSFYAVLSGESPVTFRFEYVVDPAKPNDTFKAIWSVSLTTGTETPGDYEKFFFFFPGLKDMLPKTPQPA